MAIRVSRLKTVFKPRIFLGLAIAASVGALPYSARAQFLAKTGQFGWKVTKEHFFSVGLVAAAHVSEDGKNSLNRYIESGNPQDWESFLEAVGHELDSTRLHTQLMGYGAIDLMGEGLAHLGAKFSPKVVGGFAKGFIGRQVLGIIGFFGYDFVSDLNRCIEERVAHGLRDRPLEAKLTLERMSSATSLLFDPNLSGLYFGEAKNCLQSDQPFWGMALDRMLDAENLAYWTVLASSMRLGKMIKNPVKKGCSGLLARPIGKRGAIRIGRIAGRVTSPSAAILSAGVLYQALGIKAVRNAINQTNNGFHEMRERHNQSSLEDLLVQVTRDPENLELLKPLSEERGAWISNLFAQIILSLKAYRGLLEEYLSYEPGLRVALKLASNAKNPFARRFLEAHIMSLAEQLAQVRQLLQAKLSGRSPDSQSIESLKFTEDELVHAFPSFSGHWWEWSPEKVAEVVLAQFLSTHKQVKAARKFLAETSAESELLSQSELPENIFEELKSFKTLRDRGLLYMQEVQDKLKSSQAGLEEHVKVQSVFADLVDLSEPSLTRVLRKTELIERYSRMPSLESYLIRPDALEWADPRWVRILGQDPAVILREYLEFEYLAFYPEPPEHREELSASARASWSASKTDFIKRELILRQSALDE